MKKLLYVAIFLILCGAIIITSRGCTGKKSTQDSIFYDSLTNDTAAAGSIESIIEETPMPKAADELFDDFIFNFAANKKLQLNRIEFPLPTNNGSHKTELKKNQWKMDYFFMQQNFYTLIFDDQKQSETVKDTSINHAVVEKIYLKKKSIKQYVFDRKGGSWMMTAMNTIGFSSSPNSSFLNFYNRFVSDTVFQIESINDPLNFIGPDPNNDFGTMDGILLPEQWPSFAPPLPSNMIYNIIYGHQGKGSSQKIFIIRGIANGLESELTFNKKRGKWKLTKLHM
jgi:flagellar basal body-associated protein FliL